MCGIVGLLALNTVGFNQPHITAMEQMLYADQLRGPHGTGLFYNDRDGRCYNIRGAMPATVFLKDKGAIAAFEAVYQKSSFVMGHNRWATKGAHTNDNTHPFLEGGITLIHNGTVHGHRKMKDVEVDSHAICHSIAENGAKETIKNIDGAFALVWHDADTNLLHFIRNTERPLFMVKTSNVVALASEHKLAEWVLTRNYEIVKEVVSCKVGTLYTFDPKSRKITEEDVELFTKPIYKAPKSYYPNNKWNNQDGLNQWYADLEASASDVIDAEVVEKKVSDTKIIPIRTKGNFQYEYGQRVLMTPIEIIQAGKGWSLKMIVQSGLNTADVYTLYYCNSKPWLEKLMDANTVSGTVIQTRYKGSETSLIVKDADIVRSNTSTVPAVLQAQADVMQTQYNNSQLLLN